MLTAYFPEQFINNLSAKAPLAMSHSQPRSPFDIVTPTGAIFHRSSNVTQGYLFASANNRIKTYTIKNVVQNVVSLTEKQS